MSLPSRGAWIEILHPAVSAPAGRRVAPLAGSVDRNGAKTDCGALPLVAPLAGSVDRNADGQVLCAGPLVAPLAGSVDRNRKWFGWPSKLDSASLPSRGAWIEIAPERPAPGRPPVAPLAGSVDRNLLGALICEEELKVAPLAGSVDRNAHHEP